MNIAVGGSHACLGAEGSPVELRSQLSCDGLVVREESWMIWDQGGFGGVWETWQCPTDIDR